MMKLRAYQEAAVERMISMRGNILLADEPGLGKTITTIAYINAMRFSHVVIVCPASLRLNWLAELERWLAYKTDVAIMSYEGMVKHPISPEPPLGRLIVFDEAHYLKNPKAKRTKAALKLKHDKILFLTGTPVVNRPIDLFPILALSGAKISRTEYGKYFCAGKLVQVGWRPSRWVWDFSGASHVDELNESLQRNLMIRRTKAEVLSELPSKVRQVIEIDTPNGESPELQRVLRAAYNSFTSAAGEIGEEKVDFEELSNARKELGEIKLPHVLSFLKETLLEEVEKVVVFAYHKEIIDKLYDALKTFTPVKLYGGMSDRQKNESVLRFQADPAVRVFIGQITAAGTGLTLTAANTVLFAELDWVPGNVTQAEDRCHRMGQRDTVRILHIVLRNSVDGRMVRALVEKQKIIERVTQ